MVDIQYKHLTKFLHRVWASHPASDHDLVAVRTGTWREWLERVAAQLEVDERKLTTARCYAELDRAYRRWEEAAEWTS